MMNKMNDFELSKVSGGTTKEFRELLDFYRTKGKFVEEYGPMGCAMYSHEAYENMAFAPLVEKALKEDFNIDAKISVGWGGTGFHSTKNTYSINGNGISHQEVLNILKAA